MLKRMGQTRICLSLSPSTKAYRSNMQAQGRTSPSARAYRTHLSVSLPAPRLTGDYRHQKTLRTSDELEGSGSEPQSQRRNPYFYLEHHPGILQAIQPNEGYLSNLRPRKPCSNEVGVHGRSARGSIDSRAESMMVVAGRRSPLAQYTLLQ